MKDALGHGSNGNGNDGAAHQQGVLMLSPNSLSQGMDSAKAQWQSNAGSMTARQHGLAARQHWAAADSAKFSVAERAAHQMIGNWHAQAREAMTGRGMKS